LHNLVSTQNSLTHFTSGLTGTDNQYNKISEESDTAEDHVFNSDDTNKFALNLESTFLMNIFTNSISFYLKEKSISIKKQSL
jgi:hypothetical protein